MTDAPERIHAWVYRDGDRMHHNWRGAVTPCGPWQTEYIRADLATPLDDPLVKARSDAIREFCEKAGLSDAVQVAGLPDDVRAYRRDSAVADMEARAALSALDENK